MSEILEALPTCLRSTSGLVAKVSEILEALPTCLRSTSDLVAKVSEILEALPTCLRSTSGLDCMTRTENVHLKTNNYIGLPLKKKLQHKTRLHSYRP